MAVPLYNNLLTLALVKWLKKYRQRMEVFLRFAFIAHGFSLGLLGDDRFLRWVEFVILPPFNFLRWV
ncbi:MAG TPA: hypothetical protein DCM62_05075 [Bacteroidales bacterium]|nr:hypothetical protein [Bacteroidales bacterium]